MADIVELLCSLLNISRCPYTSADPILDVFLYLLILPTIILIVFLSSAASLFLGTERKKWSLLLSVVFYLVIIQRGWYGTFMEFTRGYIIIFLLFAGGIFFISRFFKPEHVKMAKDLGSSLRGMSVNTRRKRLRDIDKDLEKLDEYEQKISERLEVAKTTNNKSDTDKWNKELGEIAKTRLDLKMERDRLRRWR